MDINTVSKEVQTYWKFRAKAGDASDKFDKLAEKHCDFHEPFVDKFDGEHINRCKNPEHHHAQGTLAECLVDDCPMHLIKE